MAGATRLPGRLNLEGMSVPNTTVRWKDIAALYQTDVEAHWQASQAAGLACPFDVFEQLFHDHHQDEEFLRDLRRVNWSAVSWEERYLSGMKLRQVAVPRGYEYAVDEAWARTLGGGLQDQREDVLSSWKEAHSWVRSPVLVEGPVIGTQYEYELQVGFTRLGDLLGLLDRGEVAEWVQHSVWIGSPEAKVR